MARTAADIEAEIDKLEALASRGILRVRHGDSETTYQNMTEMQNRIERLRSQLASANGRSTKQFRFITGKGL